MKPKYKETIPVSLV